MLIYATHLLAACCGAFVAFLWFLFSEHREVQEAQRIADEITVEAMRDGVERWKKRHCK